MDTLHELKARWLTRAFAVLAATLTLVVGQGVVLGIEPPSPPNRSSNPAVVVKAKASDGQGQQSVSSSAKFSKAGGNGIRSAAARSTNGDAP
jgi:hypothetical protein